VTKLGRERLHTAIARSAIILLKLQQLSATTFI
jgi:hypothetical protein